MARNRGLLTEDEDGHGRRPLVAEDVAPHELVDAFLYGDQLHYGKRREAPRRWQQDEATAR